LKIGITLMGVDVSDEHLDVATRELLKDLRAETDPRARLLRAPAPAGSMDKGDLIGLGQIALALVTGGAVTTLIERLFAFLSRNKKIIIEVQNAGGEKLKLNMDFVSRHGTEKAISLAEAFLRKTG
jgi:hypothetical protein